ncbi:MAG: RelA/SpoT family protein, partial [Paracoccaceae bacterium]
NMRTIKAMRPDKQVQKARETMDIYAPLAGRMGMQWMREELEDLAFRVLNPEGRASIIRRFIRLQKETGDVIPRITGDMRHELSENDIEAEVLGRAKKPYSIWRKMQTKEIPFSRLSDIYGFRIITTSEMDCYRALGAIHQRWRAVPERFKDYISQPKQNGYRSIHTTVSGRNARRVEVQLRTQLMHDVAETGVAAHWSYKDGVRTQNPFAVDPARWLSDVTKEFDQEEDHDAFLEAIKLEMHSDQVFCFSPKGEVIPLPRGATPIDFAYAIHTGIGSSCVGAKVDGVRLPLWTRLKNGQSVEIIRASGQQPQANWLDIAITGKAKTAIRRGLRDADRERYIRLGRELARSAFESLGKKASDKVLERAANTQQLDSVETLFARLGSGELSATNVVRAVFPNISADTGAEIERTRLVVGLDSGESYERAACCQALPSERIMGLTRKGKGVQIHAIDCPVLARFEDETDRWLDLHWAVGTHPAIYTVTLEVTIGNDAGVLGRICTLIGEHKANISDLKFADRKPDFFRLLVDLDLRDTGQLHSITSMLAADEAVALVRRRRDMNQADAMALAE